MYTWGMKSTRREVTEVEGVSLPNDRRLYEFVVIKFHGRDDDGRGFWVSAKGPRGETMATVYGDVDETTVVGARF